MPVTKNNLNFYLTGNDPFSSLSDTSQSIGGYPTSLYAPTASLVSDMTVTTINTSPIPISDSGYVLSGSEVLYVDLAQAISFRGSLNTPIESHASGDPISELNNALFNNSFNANLQQYRCIAVKNASSSNIFYDLSLYVKRNSITQNTQIALGIEVPSSDLFTGIIDSGSIITVVDAALASFNDDYFTDAVITMTSGNNINQQRIVISFDKSTKTLVLNSALPFAAATGDNYKIDCKPSQRLIRGIDTPIVNFIDANSLIASLDINVGNTRTNGSDLHPGEVVYLWIRRTRTRNSIETLNNRIVISAHYGKV